MSLQCWHFRLAHTGDIKRNHEPVEEKTRGKLYRPLSCTRLLLRSPHDNDVQHATKRRSLLNIPIEKENRRKNPSKRKPINNNTMHIMNEFYPSFVPTFGLVSLESTWCPCSTFSFPLHANLSSTLKLSTAFCCSRSCFGWSGENLEGGGRSLAELGCAGGPCRRLLPVIGKHTVVVPR